MNHKLLWTISISALVPQFSMVLTLSPVMYTILLGGTHNEKINTMQVRNII